MQPHNTHQEAGPRPASIRANLAEGGFNRAMPPAILNAAPNAKTLTRCLWRRIGWALGLGALLAGLAGAGAWVFAPPPKHQVRTLIQIPPAPHYVIRTGEQVPDTGSHQRTQMALGRSRLVLNSALKDQEVVSLPMVVNRIDPVEWLEKELQVDFTVAPEIMRISMNGMETAELEKLVNAVRRAYLREVVDKSTTVRRERLGYLADLIQKYDDQLKVNRAAQKDIEEQLGGKNPDVRGRVFAFLQSNLSFTERELINTKAKLREARLAVEGIKSREAKGKPAVLINHRAVEEALDKDPEVTAYKDQIKALEARMAETEKRAASGQNHPSYVRDRREVASLKQKLDKALGRLRPSILKDLQERGRLDVETSATIQQVRIESLEATEKDLDTEIQHLHKKLTDLGKKNVKLDAYREDMSHVEEMTKRFKAEHEALKVELQAPSQVRVLEEATVSRVNVEGRKWMITGGAALVALCFGLFSVSWLEYRFRRVGTVDEVVLGLGMRLVGTVPDTRGLRRAQGAGQDNGRQVLADSVDAARTLLLHMARTHSLRTVMVTSAVAGEGKTSLSSHLAASLARAGLKTLLVDADIRNPRIHKLFGVPGDVGFSEVLTGKAEAGPNIRATAVRDLFVLPAGRWSDDVCLALNRGRVAALFEQLREQHDIILIDSSPVLPVTDALMIGQQVDGVLLSVLCQVSRLNNVYAAWQRIEDLGIPTLGVVVNGVSGSLYGATYSYAYHPRAAQAQGN